MTQVIFEELTEAPPAIHGRMAPELVMPPATRPLPEPPEPEPSIPDQPEPPGPDPTPPPPASGKRP
jgi:hypothetical protein